MNKIKIGVLGIQRGESMISYCLEAGNAQVVAICDKWVEGLEKKKKEINDDSITYYTDFEDFIKHDMDAVVLANYAHEHAPFAIRCMKEGKHVLSEVLPCANMKEAVELIEAVEETGKIYAYAENYCFMAAPYEMRKLYRQGKIGEFEYGEGEYAHNCEPIWADLTDADPNHWRNNMFSTFYCTHSIGPIVHITGLRPVRVTGYESTLIERGIRMGRKNGQFAIEMLLLENGGIYKSLHGGVYKNSVWYAVYGSKGRMESAREDAKNGGVSRIYVNADEYSGQYGEDVVECYEPVHEVAEQSAGFGHGGSDYYIMYNFVEKIKGRADADVIDVYEAMDMCLPGLFAYRSILAGGIPVDIPNLRNKAERDKYRNDTTCSFKDKAGDMYVPPFSKGEPDIPASVYEELKKKISK